MTLTSERDGRLFDGHVRTAVLSALDEFCCPYCTRTWPHTLPRSGARAWPLNRAGWTDAVD